MTNRFVVGYEGRRHEGSLAAWGTAALRIGDELVNAGSGLRLPWNDDVVDRYVEKGTLTRLPAPIEIERVKRPIVLEVATAALGALGLSLLTKEPPHVLRMRRFDEATVFVFSDRGQFTKFRENLVNKLLDEIFYRHDWSDGAGLAALCRLGLTLDAHHPAVNAVRVATSAQRRDGLDRFYRAAIHDDDEKARYQRLLDAIDAVLRARAPTTDAATDEERQRVRVELVYKDGIARDGGLDADEAETLFHRLNKAHSFFAREVKGEYPFLQVPPANRVEQLLAASAHVVFNANVGPSVGERVARFLELGVLDRALRGELPEPLADDDALTKVMSELRQPDDATAVQVRPLGSAAFVSVVKSEAPAALAVLPPASEALDLLAYQSGGVNELERLELVTFPGMRIRVSSRNNGDGDPPLGAGDIISGRHSFEPLVARVQRLSQASGRPKYILREVRPLRRRHEVGAIPSSFVKDGFVYGLSLTVDLNEEGVFRVNGEKLGSVDARDRTEARAWMKAYAAFCRHTEMTDLRYRRLAPIVMPEPSPAMQMALTLLDAEGPITQHDAIERGRARFGRRAPMAISPLRGSPMFSFDEDLISLKDEGRRAALAWRAIQRRHHSE